jgi:hypothetical protein
MLNRAEFIRVTGGTLLAALFSVLPEVTPSAKRVILCETFIAGLQYYRGALREHRLHTGSEVLLIREADNPQDSNALAFFSLGGNKLGYLPASLNPIVAALVDQGIPVRACILSVNPGAPHRARISVRIFLDLPV